MLASGSEDIDMFKLSIAQSTRCTTTRSRARCTIWRPISRSICRTCSRVIPQDVLDAMMVDGHLYGIPVYCSPNRMNCLIRQDWLDNLGLETPTTLEELHARALYALPLTIPTETAWTTPSA